MANVCQWIPHSPHNNNLAYSILLVGCFKTTQTKTNENLIELFCFQLLNVKKTYNKVGPISDVQITLIPDNARADT